MFQETHRVPAPLQWSGQTLRGIPRRWRLAIEAFAATARHRPGELAGLLWDTYPGDPEIEIVENVAADPAACFEIKGSLPAGVRAVVHSHPAGCEWPSAADQAQQIATGVSWVIVPSGGEAFAWGGTLHPEHLIHRPFRWGVTDCWGAVRDGLRSLQGVHVANYPREWQFWRDGVEGALFEQRIRSEGFEIVSEDLSDAQEGDVVLFRLHAPVFNHAALVVSGGAMYHHPTRSSKPYDPTVMACVEPTDRYSKIPCGVCRRAP